MLSRFDWRLPIYIYAIYIDGYSLVAIVLKLHDKGHIILFLAEKKYLFNYFLFLRGLHHLLVRMLIGDAYEGGPD